MDTFMNLAKQGLEAYQSQQHSHSDVSKTGGAEYNAPSHQQQGNYAPEVDHDYAVQQATESGSGDPSLYSSAIQYAQSNSHVHHEQIDENHVQDAHRQAYQEGGASNLSASSMGGAAALQAMRMFTASGGSEGGANKSQLISLAMSEASKLFDSAGGSASGNKQDAVNGAAMTVMKLLVQSKFTNAIGGENSGGISGLVGMASKFL